MGYLTFWKTTYNYFHKINVGKLEKQKQQMKMYDNPAEV